MKYTIDLRPYPGARYFTVDGHRKAYDKLSKKPAIGLESIKNSLRRLFVVPDNFAIGFFDFIYSDLLLQHRHVLDISYLFPQGRYNFSEAEAVMLRPHASMGVPVGFFILFYDPKNWANLPVLTIAKDDEFYLLQMVMDDYEQKGVDMLVRETNYKAAVLYQMIAQSPLLNGISEKETPPKTIVAARCSLETADKLRSMGYIFGEKPEGDEVVISFANFPTHSKEMIEMLADRVASL